MSIINEALFRAWGGIQVPGAIPNLASMIESDLERGNRPIPSFDFEEALFGGGFNPLTDMLDFSQMGFGDDFSFGNLLTNPLRFGNDFSGFNFGGGGFSDFNFGNPLNFGNPFENFNLGSSMSNLGNLFGNSTGGLGSLFSNNTGGLDALFNNPLGGSGNSSVDEDDLVDYFEDQGLTIDEDTAESILDGEMGLEDLEFNLDDDMEPEDAFKQGFMTGLQFGRQGSPMSLGGMSFDPGYGFGLNDLGMDHFDMGMNGLNLDDLDMGSGTNGIFGLLVDENGNAMPAIIPYE